MAHDNETVLILSPAYTLLFIHALRKKNCCQTKVDACEAAPPPRVHPLGRNRGAVGTGESRLRVSNSIFALVITHLCALTSDRSVALNISALAGL